jgi:cell division GTPase FtsZ
MKVFFIGLGQAGCKITDIFLADDISTRANRIFKAIAVNSARPDLLGLR